MNILETSVFPNGDELVLMRYTGTYSVGSGEQFTCTHFIVGYFSASNNFQFSSRENFLDEEDAYSAFVERNNINEYANETLFGMTIERMWENTRNC